MIKRLLTGGQYFFGLHAPGRNLKVFPGDIFLVSYPKSGNTWTRFLMANLVYPEKNPDFANINDLIPDSEAMAKRDLERASRPRILKGHQYFDPRYPKVIYIVRDPRDVVLSKYYFDIKRREINEDYPVEKFVSSFVRGELDHPYGTWGKTWQRGFIREGRVLRYCWLRMRRCNRRARTKIGRIAEFLGVRATPERIAFALAQSTADRMHELER